MRISEDPKKSYRIALVADRYAPERGGGEAYVANLARTLSALGHEVRVFARSIDGSPGDIRVHQVPVFPLGKALGMVSFAFNAAHILSGMDFDVIHGTGKCLGVNVFNPHGGVERAWLIQNYRSCSSGLYRALVRLKRALSLRHYFTLWQQRRVFGPRGAARIIAISDMVARDIQKFHGTSPERISVVYNGVDLDRFSPQRMSSLRDSAREELGIHRGETVLLNVGHNFRLKGIAPLIRAAAQAGKSLPDQPFRLLVAGKGRPKPYLKLAEKLGLGDKVFFLGVRSDIERLYASADIYVHPTFYDACSLVLFEAMASGLPVVTTRNNGAAWALDGGEGAVVDDPLDTDSLARAIVRMFNPEAREKAARSARMTAEKFPAARNAEQIVGVYEKLVSEAVHQ
jgi:UDP-glucose:(heptosyl)LPS alpha-1,3-glucosyltransferase